MNLPHWATAAEGSCAYCSRPAVAGVMTLGGTRLVCSLCLDLERAARGEMTFKAADERYWREVDGEC